MKAKQTQEIQHLKFCNLQMSNIFSRILFVHYILNLLILYLVPKKLRAYLPWFSCFQKEQEQPISSTPPISPSLPSLPKKITLPATMDVVELSRIFEVFDHNGDGRITHQELKKSLESMGIFIQDSELDQMIEKIDVNEDGCVDIGEFGSLYKSIMEDPEKKGEGEEAGEEDMKEAFNVFDKNGDGFISVEELRSVLGSLGLKQGMDVGDCKKMIMKVDVDGNGLVDYDEFKMMMRLGGDGFAAIS